jgi:hypothetical protein
VTRSVAVSPTNAMAACGTVKPTPTPTAVFVMYRCPIDMPEQFESGAMRIESTAVMGEDPPLVRNEPVMPGLSSSPAACSVTPSPLIE